MVVSWSTLPMLLENNIVIVVAWQYNGTFSFVSCISTIGANLRSHRIFCCSCTWLPRIVILLIGGKTITEFRLAQSN